MSYRLIDKMHHSENDELIVVFIPSLYVIPSHTLPYFLPSPEVSFNPFSSIV